MKKLHILFLSILPALVILFCFWAFWLPRMTRRKSLSRSPFWLPAQNIRWEQINTGGVCSHASCMAAIPRLASF